MRFKSTRFAASIPTINLTPMLNVVMVVLAFFVLVSLTLTSEPTSVDVALPGKEDEEAIPTVNPDLPEFLAVRVDPEGKISIDGQYYTQEQLLQDVPAYLQNNPENSVYVIPDPGMPYENVMQLLVELREVGGDRVSLAVGNN
ncbi:MAG TPA: biopolymer transporter ExbD [Oscillatoriales cyanobacterium M59_W2019_021]|nr:MAG: biopolymer transporter ExbD [Cyanobacteria bacterium J055]HIK29916.1 biopolymer transporter ExbD [Oscillatoriales cyanobacterium M4454_W2019_049]HIK51385.1 biopolymer transporter ExbD [Oscillatoriales cyanobacterium M59_W2019_021]